MFAILNFYSEKKLDGKKLVRIIFVTTEVDENCSEPKKQIKASYGVKILPYMYIYVEHQGVLTKWLPDWIH